MTETSVKGDESSVESSVISKEPVKENTRGKFSFGFGGKNKKKAAAAKAAAEEKEKKQKQKKEEEKNNKEQNLKQDIAVLSGDEEESGFMTEDLVDDNDPQYALHKKIVKMTSDILTKGAADTAYKDYIDEFKTRRFQLQSDRTNIVKRESADFLVTLKQSKEDPAKKVIVYGSGVEYIAQKLYLPENNPVLLENNVDVYD